MSDLSILEQIANERKELQRIIDRADQQLFDREIALGEERILLNSISQSFKDCNGFPSVGLIKAIRGLKPQATEGELAETAV